jgi:heterodisulfide reductase subunit A-like polyferredoxin/coenzyme F420-reducing hydrogenase delta subunit/bacterioferritin-associated ferredoxin
MLLDSIRALGIHVPTLCHHPSLEPNGACRLCVVEIAHPNWNGWTNLVTSCLYPAAEGLQVFTRSDRVREMRGTLLQLYMAQYPGARELRDMARDEGVDTTPFPVNEELEKCVLCGLCTRVCQDLSVGAIAPLSRGTSKEVGPRPDMVGEDCTACGACAYICPTGAIPMVQNDGKVRIWNRDFDIPTCKVDEDLCRGCGICEEVCPWAIPRVMPSRTGAVISTITPTHCVGCGICAGACPTGAIRQDSYPDTVLGGMSDDHGDLKGQTVVFACSRSPFPEGAENVIRVPCIGRVGVEHMLECIARGADGVMTMCRDQATCPYGPGGHLGEIRTRVADELAVAAGLGSGRIRYEHPAPGLNEPAKALAAFRKSLEPTPLGKTYARSAEDVPGMDRAVEILRWLRAQPGLEPVLPDYLQRAAGKAAKAAAMVDKAAKTDRAALHEIADLDRLLSLVVSKWRLKDEIASLDADTLRARIHEDKHCEGFRFQITHKERKELAEKAGATNGSKDCLHTIAQKKIIEREGAWQESAPAGMRMPFPEAGSALNQADKAGAPVPSKTNGDGKTAAVKIDEATRQSAGAKIDEAKRQPAAAKLDEATQQPDRRIFSHPILAPLPMEKIDFTFNGTPLKARKGEVISSALYAAGIPVLGHHRKDGGAQGIFCVNGQCSQCTVVADGRPVKSCMVPVKPGMKVESCEGLPVLGDASPAKTSPEVEELEIQVLVVGGGPAGICAAIELGRLGVGVLIIDDKQELGGKLSLQTHNFFGSVADCYAGTRGIDIGHILADEVAKLPTVKVWLNSTVIGVFSDHKFGVAGEGHYRLVKPEVVLISAGAREKSLAFPGADLPGVYGAGAFQTLVNRDQVKAAERLFVVGGGNVGLIGAYHALQAGIDVVGLVEALPRCGGYKVHEDKIRRLGVPVWTSHTVLRAEGNERVERVITAAVDEKFRPVAGTERSFDVDTVLIAVGLSPVDELLQKAREYGMKVYAAGDSEEIAEASAAIFSGKITGREIARDIGMHVPIPSDWHEFGEVLKHKPAAAEPFDPKDLGVSVYPLIRCVQEIPCDPCTEACPHKLISMPGSILSLPEFNGECQACGRCVLACPGLAIQLVINDYDPKGEKALIMMPFEFSDDVAPPGTEIATTDIVGNVVGKGRVVAIRKREDQDRRRLLLVEVPMDDKLRVAGFRIREPEDGAPAEFDPLEASDPMICRCERVRKSEIVEAIRAGVRDMNQLKAVARSGMGGCGGKTCTEQVLRIYREEGVDISEVTLPSIRPLVAEIHLGDFVKREGEEAE